jgi:hypothetical protein
MPSNPITLDSHFLPEEPLDPRGAEFFDRVTEMLDGQPKDPAVAESALSGWNELLDKIAAELYRLGSMLLGEGEEAIGLIERVVANVDLPACCDHREARHKARLLLATEAISVLATRHPSSLAAPADDSGPASCIEDDDLSAAGVTSEELEQMISGPDGNRLRSWLEGLPDSLRVIFVLRAVAGLSSAEIAGLLSENDGLKTPGLDLAVGWTPSAVRGGFRQALCSLASQLIHATSGR